MTSELLRSEIGDEWEAITTDPWTDGLGQGTLSRSSMVRYLVQDHRFLDAFTVLLSATLSKTISLEDRVFGAQFLALVLGEENTYFERSFAALEVSALERSAPSEPETAAFDELMRSAAASGKLHVQLAVLCVAEWSYLTWGERVAKNKKENLPFYFDEWISLHSGTYFQQVVAYLRGLLDALSLSPAELDEARTAFRQAARCERDFWHMLTRV